MATKTSKTAAAKKKAQAPKSHRIDPVKSSPAKSDEQFHKETAKLLNYVNSGMAKFKLAIETQLSLLVKADRPASELSHLYGAVRDMATAIGESTKPIGDATGLLGNKLIPEAFEREKITSFTTSNGYRVVVSTVYRASIKADFKGSAYEWLQTHDLADLITQTVNASTLSAAGKALIDEKGMELPDEFFNAAYMPMTSLTKVKK